MTLPPSLSDLKYICQTSMEMGGSIVDLVDQMIKGLLLQSPKSYNLAISAWAVAT